MEKNMENHMEAPLIVGVMYSGMQGPKILTIILLRFI